MKEEWGRERVKGDRQTDRQTDRETDTQRQRAGSNSKGTTSCLIFNRGKI